MQAKNRTNRTPKLASRAASRTKGSNRKQLRQPAFIADWRDRVKALTARIHENRGNKKYDVLNADKWYSLTGHVSNRVEDLDAHLAPAERVVRQIRTALQRPSGRSDVAGLVETLSAHLADTRRMLIALQGLRDYMYAELKWYEDELFKGLRPEGGR